MVKHRRAPRRAETAVTSLVATLQPVSALAEVQRAWPAAAGPALAGQATPTSMRDGVVTLSCTSAVYAQELTLMARELAAALNAELGPGVVRELRCRAAAARGWTGRFS